MTFPTIISDILNLFKQDVPFSTGVGYTIGTRDILNLIAPPVADAAARDVLFPSPVGDERVFNKTTGRVERYSALISSWIADSMGSRVIAASSTPLSIYGATGASDQTVISFTVPANTIVPNSILELDMLAKFVTLQTGGGRSIKVSLGGQILAQVFPVNGITSFHGTARFYVSPDLQTLYAFSQNFNDVSAPTTGQGAPFSVSSSHSTAAIAVDMTVNQTFLITMKPVNNDFSELTGFSLTNTISEYIPTARIHVSTTLGCWGDSLTAATGSVAPTGYALNQSGTTTNGSAVVTVASTVGVLAGMVITGAAIGIPADTTVLSFVANTSITMSNTVPSGAGTGATQVVAGGYPEQLRILSAGRPVWNSGIGALTSAQILALAVRDKVRARLWNEVIWVGRNDVGTAGFQANVLANVAAMVAQLVSGTKFVVCSVTPAITETTGSSQNIAILACNAALLATYPSNYVDLFTLLTTGSGDGTVNTLYRATGGDTVHLNDLGYAKVAAAINTKLIALGA